MHLPVGLVDTLPSYVVNIHGMSTVLFEAFKVTITSLKTLKLGALIF